MSFTHIFQLTTTICTVGRPLRGAGGVHAEERTVGYHNDAKHTVGVSVLRQPGLSAVARGRSTFQVRK